MSLEKIHTHFDTNTPFTLVTHVMESNILLNTCLVIFSVLQALRGPSRRW